MSDGRVVISTELDSKPVEEGKKKIEKNLKKIDVNKLEKDLDNVSKSFENTNKKIDLQETKLSKLKEAYEKATDVDKKNKIEEQMLNTESSIIKLNGQLDKLGDKMVSLDSKINLGKAQQEIEALEVKTQELNSETEKLSETVKEIDAPIEELTQSVNEAATETAKLNEELNNVNQTSEQTATETKKIKTTLSEAEKEAIKLEKQMEKLKHTLGGEVPEATKEAYQNIYKFNQEIRSASRQFGTHSQEAMKARNALNEYVLGLDDTTFKQVYMRSQLGLTDAQLTQQANSIKLNARMIKLMSSQTEILTQRMQGLQDKGIKPKDLLPTSTLGQFKMLNETIQASGNPIYKLSAGYRALGASMEQTIKGWSAQKMAVKLAGDDMVKYGLLLRGITAGQASLAMAFPLVGIAAVLAYGAIFKSALQADEGLQKLAETAKTKLGQAFKPLLEVAGMVAKVFLEMTIKVADMMIKFNELHPIISKVAAAILFLLPAMTLLLLPLNMGIGLLAGWKVAINAAWVAIGGIASAVGLAASTFLIFAVAIGAVVGGLIYLWNTNEGFKNAVISAWSAISEKGKEVFGGIAKYFTETLPNAFKEGGFKGVAESIGNSISDIAKSVAEKAPQLIKSGNETIKNFLTGVQESLPSILAKGSEIITNIINGISVALPQIIQKMNETRLIILNAIASNLPQIMQTGVQIITLLIQGIAQALPLLMNIGIQIITAIINTIVANLPTIISTGITILNTLLNGIIQALPVLIGAGIEILTALVDAITQNLPMIIESALSIIDTLINGITELLPTILDAGIQILISIIDGIVQTIPKLIEMLPKIIEAVVTVITENLPKIIEAGIKILVAVINGIIQALPQLIAVTPQLITSIVTTIIANLPQIIEAGVKILVAVIEGLIQAIPQLIGAIPQITSAIIKAFASVDWSSIGRNIMAGIGEGITNGINSLVQKAQNSAQKIKDAFTGLKGFDIHSPSKWGKNMVGRNIIKGIDVGIDYEMPNLLKSTDSEISKLTSKLQSTVNYETARTTASISANANKAANVSNTTQTITNEHGINLNIENFNNNSNQDVEELSQELAFLSKRNTIS